MLPLTVNRLALEHTADINDGTFIKTAGLFLATIKMVNLVIRNIIPEVELSELTLLECQSPRIVFIGLHIITMSRS